MSTPFTFIHHGVRPNSLLSFDVCSAVLFLTVSHYDRSPHLLPCSVCFLGSPGRQTARTRDPVTPPLTFQLSHLEKDAITICEPGNMRRMRCEEFIPKMELGNAGQMTVEYYVPSLVLRSIDYTWQRLTRAKHFAITSFYSYKTCRPRFDISVLQI